MKLNKSICWECCYEHIKNHLGKFNSRDYLLDKVEYMKSFERDWSKGTVHCERLFRLAIKIDNPQSNLLENCPYLLEHTVDNQFFPNSQ